MRRILNRALAIHAAAVLSISFTSQSRAADPQDFQSQDVTSYIHDHTGWSVVLCPLFVGSLGLDDGGSSGGATEFGASVRIDRSLSHSTSLTAAAAFGAGTVHDRGHTTFLLEFGPNFIAPVNQHDRFYIGPGAALLGTSSNDSETDWGGGPRIVMGVDYSISGKVCAVVEGNAGFAYMGGSRRQGDVVNTLGNVAGWARLLFGIRLRL